MIRTLISLAAALLLAGGATAGAYELGAGDVLELRVRHLLDEPDRVIVDPDGEIPVPMLDMLAVAGYTPAEAAAEIRRLYLARNLLVAPDLTLSLVEARPVYVEGDVREPGAYPYEAGMTVQQAVARAGGYRSALFPSDPAIIASDARASLESAARDRLAATLRAARLEAELAGAGTFPNPTPEDPAAEGPYLSELKALAIAGAHWRVESAELARSVAIADEEIAAIDARKREIETLVGLREAEVARYRDLTRRGIQPVPLLHDAERNASASRAELLEQDVLVAQARERRTAADLALKNRTADREMSLLEGIAANSAEAARQRAEGASAAFKLAYASGLDRSAPGAAGGLPITLGLKHRGSPESLPASEDTVLTPGDTLKVTVPLPEGFAASLARPEG